jgi:uncharacterized protein YegJ (DUF2314 family)
LPHPQASVVQLGILTDASEADLAPLLDREAVAKLVTWKHCGADIPTCDAVIATVRDSQRTHLDVVPAINWHTQLINVDAEGKALTPRERATVKKRARVYVVNVTGPTTTKHLPLRTGFAVAAAISEKIDGLVYDQLLERIERASDFAKHAVIAPIEASAFRSDRIAVQFAPRADGTVRLLTAGLARFGAPDVEVHATRGDTVPRLSDVVLGVAEALANGATSSPITLSLDDLAHARGSPYAADAGFPPPAPVPIALEGVHPENGDPNDFFVRIAPPEGATPAGYLAIAESFFGLLLPEAPSDDALREKKQKVQKALAGALARYDAEKAHGAKLFVQLPFAITGDEQGFEAMWIEVTAFDAANVTGTLADDPLGATTLARGAKVTRPRRDVLDYSSTAPQR